MDTSTNVLQIAPEGPQPPRQVSAPSRDVTIPSWHWCMVSANRYLQNQISRQPWFDLQTTAQTPYEIQPGFVSAAVAVVIVWVVTLYPSSKPDPGCQEGTGAMGKVG